ncbi:MAG: glycosyltransferase family 9 protein [Gammaproteobacteria bacterium]|jgi:lipopolysaccharide heptosyltransferase I
MAFLDAAPKILIIKPSSLGDIIHGLQVAQSIKEQLPDCTIDWVVRERFFDIVDSCNTVDDIFIYYRKGGWGAFKKLIKQIRQKQYDYVFDFQGLLRSGIMTFFARGNKKIGRKDAREFSKFCYQQKVALPKGKKPFHAMDILLQFLSVLGLKAELVGHLQYQTEDLTSVDKRLASCNPIVIMPSSRNAKKEWQGFAELTDKILTTFPDEFVCWNGHIKIEADKFEEHPRFINTTGKTNIRQMISLIAQSRMVIANDSGPMHLAAAMNKPVIGIFGPTSAKRFGPYPQTRDTNVVITAPDNDLTKLSVDAVFGLFKRCLHLQEV